MFEEKFPYYSSTVNPVQAVLLRLQRNIVS